MRYPNNPILEEMLVRGGRADLALAPDFQLDDQDFARHCEEIHQQALHDDRAQVEARAVYRLLTMQQPAVSAILPAPAPVPSRWQLARARALR